MARNDELTRAAPLFSLSWDARQRDAASPTTLQNRDHFPVDSSNDFYAPEIAQIVNNLYVVMQSRKFEALPAQYNSSVMQVLESYGRFTADNLKLQRKIKAERKVFEEERESWHMRESLYEGALRELEIALARGAGGVEGVMVARSASCLERRCTSSRTVIHHGVDEVGPANQAQLESDTTATDARTSSQISATEKRAADAHKLAKSENLQTKKQTFYDRMRRFPRVKSSQMDCKEEDAKGVGPNAPDSRAILLPKAATEELLSSEVSQRGSSTLNLAVLRAPLVRQAVSMMDLRVPDGRVTFGHSVRRSHTPASAVAFSFAAGDDEAGMMRHADTELSPDLRGAYLDMLTSPVRVLSYSGPTSDATCLTADRRDSIRGLSITSDPVQDDTARLPLLHTPSVHTRTDRSSFRSNRDSLDSHANPQNHARLYETITKTDEQTPYAGATISSNIHIACSVMNERHHNPISTITRPSTTNENLRLQPAALVRTDGRRQSGTRSGHGGSGQGGRDTGGVNRGGGDRVSGDRDGDGFSDGLNAAAAAASRAMAGRPDRRG